MGNARQKALEMKNPRVVWVGVEMGNELESDRIHW